MTSWEVLVLHPSFLLFAEKKINKSPGTRGDGFPISSFFADGDAESAPAERDARPIHAGCVRARAGEPGPDWTDPRVDPAEPTGPGRRGGGPRADK